MKTIKRFKGRIALAVLAILLLLTMLVSCGTPAVKTLSYSTTTIDTVLDENDKKQDTDKTKLQYGLRHSDFKKVAALFSDSYGAGFNALEALLAAYRGYDMTASDYDPNADFSEEKPFDEKSLAAVQNVIKKANTTAVNAKKAEHTFADSELTNKDKTGLLDRLNQNDVELLIAAFRVKVTNQGNNFLDSILSGIGMVLSFITKYLGFGNYVVGICLFAILIEILMIPFAIKQQKNSIKQAKLRPKEMAIRNKYRGRKDQPTQQKIQAEIQELYQRENFNPASGCLQLIIQLPIIMALYSIVMDPLRYMLGQAGSVTSAITAFASTARAAGGLGMTLDSSRGTIELLSQVSHGGAGMFEQIGDFRMFEFGEGVLDSVQNSLSWVPNFNIGPINFGIAPMAKGWGDWTTWVLLLIPVLTFLTYFITAKLNRKFMYQSTMNDGMDPRQVACSNSMMDITMPAMSAFFTFAVPSVIGVYWAFRSWVGFGKTVAMSKVMPLPTFTEEDYKAAEKEMAGKKSFKKSDKVGTVRSLHYIDDEDFEDTRERGLARRAAIEERERAEKEAREKGAKFAAAPLKEDNKHEDKKTPATQEPEAPETNEPEAPATQAAPEEEKKDNE